MNDQQIQSLLLLCALIMIPAGMLLTWLGRFAARQWARLAPPRYLRRVALERRPRPPAPGRSK